MEEDLNKHLDWGETVIQPHEEVEFSFSYYLRENQHVLKVKFDIPLKESVQELTYRLVASHSIPCYIEDELQRTLTSFVQQKTQQFNNATYQKLFQNLKVSDLNNKLAQEWGKAFLLKQTGKKESSIETTWSDIYHALIHSPALEDLLQLEHSYSIAMKHLVKQRDDQLQELRDKQAAEMEEIVSNVGVMKTDEDVNALSVSQLEESQMAEIYWSSALSQLQETQKREYKEWVLTVHEKLIANDSYNNFQASTRIRSPSIESFQVNYEVASSQETNMEESFTIHLGNQMKSMHNIRLVCRDMLAYSKCKTVFVGGSMVPQPQRLQTAMSLYSESLSAMILLVDDRLQARTGITKRFHDICNESTDFHFPDFDKQLSIIEEGLETRPVRTRTLRTSSLLNQKRHNKTNKLLQTGDFYITKHSNLAEVHTVFHLVSDESVSSSTINSRHPIMIGLRNIMLASARHSIKNLIIPLLLVHEMGENLTVQWCMKRAELVYKCVKGFMMEGLSWDDREERTLQFVVPTGISEELFTAFNNMFPTIFRVSTTLDLSNLAANTS